MFYIYYVHISMYGALHAIFAIFDIILQTYFSIYTVKEDKEIKKFSN